MYVRKKARRPGIHVKVLAQIAVVIPVSLQRLLQVLHFFGRLSLLSMISLQGPRLPTAPRPRKPPTYLPPIAPLGLIFLRTFGITGNKQKRLKQKPRISCPTQS